MNEFEKLLSGIHLLAMLESIDDAQVTENVRLTIADLKVDVDQLDAHVTPRYTVRALQAIPEWDKDREIVSEVVASYLGDMLIDALQHCGIDPEKVTMGMMLAAGLTLEPIQIKVVNSLIPLH